MDQRELDKIVHNLNKTISGNPSTHMKLQFHDNIFLGQDNYGPNKFDIDLNNPIHFNMDNETIIRYGNQEFMNYA